MWAAQRSSICGWLLLPRYGMQPASLWPMLCMAAAELVRIELGRVPFAHVLPTHTAADPAAACVLFTMHLNARAHDPPPLPPGCLHVPQPMQLLSLQPRAYLMPKFLDKARCQHVIDMASKRLAPSGGWATGWAWVCWPLARVMRALSASFLPLKHNLHCPQG